MIYTYLNKTLEEQLNKKKLNNIEVIERFLLFLPPFRTILQDHGENFIDGVKVIEIKALRLPNSVHRIGPRSR